MSRRAPDFGFAKLIQKQRAQGLGWRWDGVDDWTTEAIFTQLRKIGIDTDADRFRGQAIEAGRFKVLEDRWCDQISREKQKEQFWEDFPLLSIPVLWMRLIPDVVCPDLIEAKLHRVIAASEDDELLPDVEGMPAEVAAAMELVRYLQSLPAAERAAQYEVINEGRIYDYTEWLVELIESEASKFPDVVTQIADVMSDCCQAARFQSELALALAVGGRRQEAIARVNANLLRFPDDLWVRIAAGDVFEQLEEDERAVELWRDALRMAQDHDDWHVVVQLLEEACDRTGQQEELTGWLQAHPDPDPSAARETSNELVQADDPQSLNNLLDAAPQQLTRARAVGRNDPCPCGSGKKYKKCCMS